MTDLAEIVEEAAAIEAEAAVVLEITSALVKCIKLPALSVVLNVKFLSSLWKDDQYFAEIVMQRRKNINHSLV